MAADFLNQPEITPTDFRNKERFLLSKGLSPEEVSLAFERCSPTRTSHWLRTQPPYSPVPYQPYSISPFQKFQDILKTVALFTWVAYALHKFIKVSILV